jgi:hypothetical protein
MEVATLNLTLGSAQREFLYRKGTVDEAIVVQVLKTSAFDVGRLSRAAELDALYARLAAGGKAPLIVDAAADIGASAVFFNYKFPQARIVALEPDAEKFQLLTANTAGLPVECVQAAAAAAGSADAIAPCATINGIYEKPPDTAPFIVKFDVEVGNLFAANTEWVERTPIVIAALSDHLIPGTAASRAFVECAAGWNRDFVYLHDNVFSIARAPELMQAA